MPKSESISYPDAIEQVMLRNNYWSSLRHIYKTIWEYKDKSEVKGGTPDATIRRTVQMDPRFIKIGLATYALRRHQEELSDDIYPKTEEEKEKRAHTDIQGMLLHIGNHRPGVKYTYTDHKKKKFSQDGKELGSIATKKKIPEFTCPKILKAVRRIDVIWFNDRGFPFRAFEVEHTTDFNKVFQRFMELQDFRTEFRCVSTKERKSKFDEQKGRPLFKPIERRVEFWTYDQIEDLYEMRVLNEDI